MICFELLLVAKFIHMLHKFANKIFFLYFYGTSNLIYRQRKHKTKSEYCNNSDSFVDNKNLLKDLLLECQIRTL